MNLKELRISKGLTQSDASKITKIPLRTYKRYENDLSYSSTFKYQQIYQLIKNYGSGSQNKHVNKYRIAIAGIGYVGLSLAVLLSQNHDVVITDIIKEKIDLVNEKKSPFVDKDISYYLSHKKLHLEAAYSDKESYKDKDIVIIATPTNFDVLTNSFDTSAVISIIGLVNEVNPKALIVIKSTIPIGFCEEMQQKYPKLQIVFSPEFLREGQALHDNLYPSRIIIGSDHLTPIVKEFASILEKSALNMNKTIFMGTKEAEAVKLFSNAYLAMRVAYFNELDSYAKENDINTLDVIKGMSRDERIGDYYNNPSFGYGGYCLPKDSEQLQNSFIDIPNNNLIKAIVESNKTRKEYIAEDIINTAINISHKKKEDIVIGIYSLAMKLGSDNYRSSSSVDVMNILLDKGINIIIYDKNYPDSENDINIFKKKADLIITNRYNHNLDDVRDKVYTRDIYMRY